MLVLVVRKGKSSSNGVPKIVGPVTEDYYGETDSEKSGVPHLVRTIETYNVVGFDGLFYGVPQRLGEIREWGEVNVAKMPGVVTGGTLQEIVSAIEEKLKTNSRPRAIGPESAECSGSSAPKLVGTFKEYNIVGYEGWYYGVPHALGDLRLDEVDVIEMPGVIRDVSKEVVESEISAVSKG